MKIIILIIILLILLILLKNIKINYTEIVVLNDEITKLNCPFGPPDIVCDSIHINKNWEEHLQKDIFEKYVKEGDYVIDGGAFIGNHCVKLSKLVGKTGKVYAFEAHPVTFKILEQNIKLNNCNNVVLFNKGIGDKPGNIKIEKNYDYNKGGTKWEYSSNEIDISTEVITIDSLNLHKLNFMKLDVEGMEDKVFIGMKNTILKFKPIILYEAWKDLYKNTTATLLSIYKYNISNVSNDDYLAIP